MNWVKFQNYILDWHDHYGRHLLPWRQDFDPYKIWVSEIMLQQTQVDRVIPKFEAFIKEFPTVNNLATATQDQVIRAWQGLGYNRRGLNLYKGAQYVVSNFNNSIPDTTDQLLTIPGVGPYTASAVQVFAFNKPSLVIETNIRAVFLFHFFPDKDKVSDKELLAQIKDSLPTKNPRKWYAALMDYGSHLKKVVTNPSRKSKTYIKQSNFIGSIRQVRGEILRKLAVQSELTITEFQLQCTSKNEFIPEVINQLNKEGFIVFADSSKQKIKLKK